MSHIKDLSIFFLSTGGIFSQLTLQSCGARHTIPIIIILGLVGLCSLISMIIRIIENYAPSIHD